MKDKLKLEILKIKKEFEALVKKQGRQKITMSLYILFSLIAITIFGIFAIKPTLDTISELQKEKEDGEFTLKQLETKNQSLQKLGAQYQQIENDLTTVFEAIPTSPNVPELTRKIEVIANRNNLAIDTLNTGTIELYPATRRGSQLFSFTITVTALGTENDINSFIKEIVNFDRIISIDRITTGVAERDLFSTTLTGRAYFIKE